MMAEIESQFGLAIDHDTVAASQILEIDTMVAPIEGEREALMRQAFGMHSLACSSRVQQSNGSLLQHAGAHPPENTLLSDPIENNGLDTGFREQLSKQPPGWT
jgi:hypothetical protein